MSGILTAASGSAAGSRGFSFDPFSTLGWAVPFLMLTPLAMFVTGIAVIGVARRRPRGDEMLVDIAVEVRRYEMLRFGSFTGFKPPPPRSCPTPSR